MATAIPSMVAVGDGSAEVFIRNLPFSATTADLEELCGGVGPVKRASIIQGANGVSRGFGFVKFALPEDAARAAAILHGSDFHHRRLAVELALKKGQKPANVPDAPAAKRAAAAAAKAKAKAATPAAAAPAATPTEEEGKAPEVKVEGGQAQPAKMNAPAAAAAAAAARKKKPAPALVGQHPSNTLLVFNLAAQTTEKQLFKRVKKIQPPSSVKTQELEGARVAVLTFASVGAANKVLKKLDKHEMHGQQLSLRPFHPERALKGRGARKHGEGADAGTAEGGGAVGAMLRGQAKRNSRVIVRNLSFKATEQELRKQLGAFGPVLEASIPTVRVMEGREGRRGFGFVTFACAKDAARAAAADGVSVCGREVAVDMCMGKREYQEQRDKERQDKAEAEGVKEEVVVKEEVESEGEGAGEEEHGMVVENDEDDGSEGEEGSDDEDEEEEAEEESEQEGEEEKKPAKASDVGEGKTLFVRNVPFDATNESLKDAFGTLAAVAFAVTVRDRATGMSKGTAFVKCKNAKGVEAVLAAAKAEGGVLTLLGRPLRVDRAVEREEAPQPKLVEEGKEGGAGGGGGAQRKWRVDRRNLYLANEGLVLDSEAQDAIPRSDVEKRQREQADKKSKLRNPFFFVSPTRLAIRNLGRAVLDADVRGALLKAAVQGLEQGKVAVEDMKMHLHAQGKHEEALDPKCTLVRVPKPKEVSLKVKVLRDLDKKPVDGVHPSRGYGFADFGSHAHALAALRVVNNNPAFGKLAGGAKDAERRRPRLIVSFAIENHKALHKKKLREEKGKATTAASAAAATALGKRGRSDSQGSLEEGADGGGGDDEGEKKPNRGQRQRENKRRQKELGVLPAPKAAKASRAGGSEPRAGKAARDGAGRKRKEPSGSEAPSHARHHAKQQTPPRDELDALLGDQPAGEAGKTKKGKRGKHGQQRMTQEDRSFEASVSFHKQKLQQRGGGGGGAGAGAGAAGGAAGAGAKKESNRWFQD